MRTQSLFRLLPAVSIAFVLTACTTTGRIAISPLPVAQSTYHVQPSQSDSFNHANYISLSGSFSAIGDNTEDVARIVQAKYHHAGKAGRFQYFGGAQLNAGSYKFNFAGNPLYNDNTNFYPRHQSNFVFSAAAAAGMCYVIPFNERFDWRVLGVEGNWGVESGDYYQYRKSVPDSFVTYVDRRQVQDMYFVSSEIVVRRRRSNAKIGYQIAVGSNFKKVPPSDAGIFPIIDYAGYPDKVNNIIIRNSLHFSKDPVSVYFQLYRGHHQVTFNTGITCRLGSRMR